MVKHVNPQKLNINGPLMMWVGFAFAVATAAISWADSRNENQSTKESLKATNAEMESLEERFAAMQQKSEANRELLIRIDERTARFDKYLDKIEK